MDNKAWIVTVDMGYGHQRAAYPLRHLSPTDKVILANNYEGIPPKDHQIWHNSEVFYGWISRLNNIPLVGEKLFSIFDYFQRIRDFYPRRDLSRPTLQLRETYGLIRKGWGKDLVDFLNTKNIPLITTFFIPAYMAEVHGFKNDIYTVICDADISRAWAPLHPSTSKIKYLAPCRRVVDRLKLYGVKEENIFLTGFPLPEENIGDQEVGILKSDLLSRIHNLDSQKRYRQKYADTVSKFLKGEDEDGVTHTHHPLTLTFAVGGAGAQKNIAAQALRSLKKKLLDEELRLNMVAGTRNDVYRFFEDKISEYGLKKILGRNLNIIFSLEKEDYFATFNDVLRTTDVLWTKPSELVFYSALGIPLVMAPSVGAQEIFNRTWLKTINAGISQNNPKYASEWLFDWVNSGWLAEAAMAGFLDGRQFGVKNIIDVVFKGVKEPAKNYQLM